MADDCGGARDAQPIANEAVFDAARFGDGIREALGEIRDEALVGFVETPGRVGFAHAIAFGLECGLDGGGSLGAGGDAEALVGLLVGDESCSHRGVCRVLGLDDLIGDPRFATTTDRYANGPTLVERVGAIIQTRPAAEWRDKFTAAGLQNEVVQTYRQFVDHPHTAATGLISRLVQPGSDVAWPIPNPPGVARLEAGRPEAHAPRKGEHTREILTEFGYSQAEIEALVGRSVVGA